MTTEQNSDATVMVPVNRGALQITHALLSDHHNNLLRAANKSTDPEEQRVLRALAHGLSMTCEALGTAIKVCPTTLPALGPAPIDMEHQAIRMLVRFRLSAWFTETTCCAGHPAHEIHVERAVGTDPLKAMITTILEAAEHVHKARQQGPS